MKTTKTIILALAAIALCAAAFWLTSKKSFKTPPSIGRPILPEFNVENVARVEITGAKSLILSNGEHGWTVDALHGFPAKTKTVLEELDKLKELKSGPIAAGVPCTDTVVVLKDASGNQLAKLEMGAHHRSTRTSGEMAQFAGGGFPDGRYVKMGESTVVVGDTLDAFDGDPKKWVETRICSITADDVQTVTYTKGKETVKLTRKDFTWTLEGCGPKEELDTSKTYLLDSALTDLRFSDIVDPKKTEAELGFATGTVYTATLKNGITYTAKIGNEIGTNYAFKVSASFKPVDANTNATENAACEQKVKGFNNSFGKWTYVIPSQKAESMFKARKDLVKAKEEPKKEEAKPAEKKPEAKPALAAKPAEAKKPEPKKVETKPVEKKVESKPAAKPAPAPAAKPAAAPAK